MRLTWTFSLVLGFTLLSSAAPAIAGNAGATSQPGKLGDRDENAAQPRASTRANPYSRLFRSADLDGTRLATLLAPPLTAPSEAGKPRVVCGMTVIPVDPNIDPKIHVTRPPSNTRYTIRALTPPLCR